MGIDDILQSDVGGAGTLGTATLGSLILGGGIPGSYLANDRLLAWVADGGIIVGIVRAIAWKICQDLLVAKDIKFDIYSGSGAELDAIGDVVDMPRYSYDDIDYRTFLQMQVSLFLSSNRLVGGWVGTHAAMLTMLRTFVNRNGIDPYPIWLRNPGLLAPYQYILSLRNMSLTDFDQLSERWLRRAAYAAVLGVVLLAIDDPWSIWSTGDETGDDVRVWGSATPGVDVGATPLTWGTVRVVE